MTSTNLREIIWQLVGSVPAGKVASYGQIAKLAGYPSHASYVGTTLKPLPDGSTLPWFRIVNSKGELAFPPGSPPFTRQCELLAAEGVTVLGKRVDLRRYRWDGTEVAVQAKNDIVGKTNGNASEGKPCARPALRHAQPTSCQGGTTPAGGPVSGLR